MLTLLEKPSAQITGVKVQDIGLTDATMLFDVKVDNPYTVPLPMSNVDYALSSVGQRFLSGQADLQAQVVRTIGDPRTRFLEDHLRLLRAVRFTARLGFTLEEETRTVAADMAALVRLVSAERIAQELESILTSGRAGVALRLLEETHLLCHLLPAVAAMRGVPQPEEFHPEGDVLTHTLLMLDALPAGCDPSLAWAALLHDVGKPPTL